MKIKRVNLEHCGEEDDTVVVIDVLRAFTTAAVAFSRGVKEIILADSVEKLFQLANQFPQALTIGEINGIPIEGVNYGNSPSRLINQHLYGRSLIQRTTTGTQGIMRSTNARTILAASLCCAGATARAINKLKPQSLTFVESGVMEDGWGDEDSACADFIEALVKGKSMDHSLLVKRVAESKSGRHYKNWNDPVFPRMDALIATDIDCCDFAMRVYPIGENYCLRPNY
jgi:2-phosphosulfolactate phosphatase